MGGRSGDACIYFVNFSTINTVFVGKNFLKYNGLM